MSNDIKIFTGRANITFCENICDILKIPQSRMDFITFNDGESSVKIIDSVRGCDVFFVQSLSSPVNDHLMETLIAVDALKRASAKRISLVIPYFAYARQDRIVEGRQPISAKLVANLISVAGANRVVTMEPHTAQLMAFFDIPVDGLSGVHVFLKYIKGLKDIENTIIVAPDIGGVERARFYASHLDNFPLAVINKRRDKPNKISQMQLVGDVRGKRAIIIDDMVDTAGTLVRACNLLLENGATEVLAFVVHPILSSNAQEKIQSSELKELITTDTISHNKYVSKIKVLSVSEFMATAISHIHQEISLSSLY